MSYIPKYIIKRMFPKDKCLKVVKKDGKEYLQLQMVNVINPITVPDNIKSEIGDFDLTKAPEQITVTINGKEMPFTYEDVQKYWEIWTQGKGYTLEDILNDKAAGVTIPVGGKLTLLISMEQSNLKELVPGEGDYEIVIDSKIDNPMQIKVKAKLSEYGVDFNPDDT